MLDSIRADSLFVLRPSKILSINEKFFKSEVRFSLETLQTVFFKQETTPVIALFSGKAYYNVFDLHGSILNSNNKKYYSENYLLHTGVFGNFFYEEYVDIFMNDVVLLNDYLFLRNLDSNNLFVRLKYFKNPFNYNSKKLKDNVSDNLFLEKSFYDLTELKYIFNIIKEDRVESKNAKRNYTRVSMSEENQITYDSFSRFNPEYINASGKNLVLK